MAVLGHMADAALAPVASIVAAFQIQHLPLDLDLPAAGLGDAAQHLQQRGLPVARNPRDAQDLARAQIQRDGFQPLHALPVGHGQIAHLQQHFARRRRCLVHAQQHAAPHHQLCQFSGRGLRRGQCRGHLAPAHHADRVGHIHDLAQLVGDDDDRLALFLQPLKDAEQVVGLGGGQHARGLVQDQDVGVAVERLQDLHPLLKPDRQILDHRVGVDVQLVFMRQLGQHAARLGQRGAQHRAFFRAQHDVFEDGERLHQHEVLVHHADPGGDGVVGAADIAHLAIDADLAAIGLIEPVEDRHQRGLARAVLADDAVDRARPDLQRNVLVGLDRPERLGNAGQLDRRRSPTLSHAIVPAWMHAPAKLAAGAVCQLVRTVLTRPGTRRRWCSRGR